MDYKQLMKKELESWLEDVQETEEILRKTQELFGSSCFEGKLFEKIHQLKEKNTDMLAEKLKVGGGCDYYSNWLAFYAENVVFSHSKILPKVAFEKKEFVVKDLDSLIEVIEYDKNRDKEESFETSF